MQLYSARIFRNLSTDLLPAIGRLKPDQFVDTTAKKAWCCNLLIMKENSVIKTEVGLEGQHPNAWSHVRKTFYSRMISN